MPQLGALAGSLGALGAATVRAGFDLTGLVSVWQFEGNGNDAYGSNNLTPVNAPTYAAGKLGQAASFASASSQRFTHADTASLRVDGNQAHTWAAWINLSSVTANQDLVNKSLDNRNNSYEFDLYVLSSKLHYLISNGSSNVDVVASTVLSANSWFLGLGWYDPVAQQVGAQVAGDAAVTAAWTGGTQNKSATFAIGGNGGTGGLFCNGMIDQVAFWKRVLSSDERAQLYNSGNGLIIP